MKWSLAQSRSPATAAASVIGAILEQRAAGNQQEAAARCPRRSSASLRHACARIPKSAGNPQRTSSTNLSGSRRGDTRYPAPVVIGPPDAGERLALASGSCCLVRQAAWMWQRPLAVSPNVPQRPIVFTVQPPVGLSLAGPAASASAPQLALAPDGQNLAFVVSDIQGITRLWIAAARSDSRGDLLARRRRCLRSVLGPEQPSTWFLAPRASDPDGRPIDDEAPRSRLVRPAEDSARGCVGAARTSSCIYGAKSAALNSVAS